MKKTYLLSAVLLAAALLFTSCGKKGPDYRDLAPSDLEDTSWLIGTWKIDYELESKIECPDLVKSAFELLAKGFNISTEELTDEEKEIIIQYAYEQYGADENGIFKIDEKYAKDFAEILSGALEVINSEPTEYAKEYKETLKKAGIEFETSSVIRILDDKSEIVSDSSTEYKFNALNASILEKAKMTFTKQ